jgi:hypothetical protein
MLRMDSSTDLVTASFRPWGVVHGLRLRTSRLGDDYILRELRLPHQRRVCDGMVVWFLGELGEPSQ